MGKKVEVSYNPQLGYLQTIFHHNFDFLTGIKSYTERTDGVVGVRSIEHADENCKTFDWKLTEEEMKILDSKIEECAL